MTLLYSHGANVTVRFLDGKRGTLLVSNGVSFRPKGDETYETVALARDAPVVFFNVLRTRGEGFDWAGLGRGDITTGAVDIVLTYPDLGHLASPRIEQPWVSSILGVSDDGATLTVVLGMPVPIETGMRVDFGIYDLDVASKKVTLLLALAGPFG
jgi:hypothetical protein